MTWNKGMHPQVRALYDKWPSSRNGEKCCYRAKDDPREHYVILAYAGDGQELAIVEQVADSTYPGVELRNYRLDELDACDCGHAEPATEAQKADSYRRLARNRSN